MNDALDILNRVLAAELGPPELLPDDAPLPDWCFDAGGVCPHGRNLDYELCERCADDDTETDAL